MELLVNFVCHCGAFVEDILTVPDQERSDVQGGNIIDESWDTLYCDGCALRYDVHIKRSALEVHVNVPGAIDLHTEQMVDSSDVGIWEIETTSQLEMYKKIMQDVVVLLGVAVPIGTQGTLYNMLYTKVVTAIEAYLSGIFIDTVINSDDLIRKLVESDPELAKRQFSLKEIFTQWNDLKNIVAKYLKDLIFHDIKKIKPMYRDVLEIDFGQVAWLFLAIRKRHDFVHRNGFDKEGVEVVIDKEMIFELIKNCTKLVALIEDDVFEKHKSIHPQ